jgi:nicotinamide-nucleotide amidase
MHVEIITIGDELLLGLTADSNANFLARELAAHGIVVDRVTTCGDDEVEILAAVREAIFRTGAIITTGGLGPTSDDVTRDAVAAAFARELVRDERVVAHLESVWRARGRTAPLPESNLAQALVPEGGTVLHNAHGTAPGVLVEDAAGNWLAMLPGVPREMRGVFRDELLPRLLERARDERETVVRSATLRTTGIAESALADRLGDADVATDGVTLAYIPTVAGVDLRLTARDVPASDADRVLRAGMDALRERVGEWAYAEGDTDLAEVVLDMARTRALRVAVAESCTGGLLGARITRIPGSSDVFHGGIISYDNRVKRQLLGVLDSDIVEHGAVSEPVALQMAKGVRVRLGTEIGVGITGVAGPGGGSEAKPVGTVWIALDLSEGRPPVPRPAGQPDLIPFREARVFHFGGDRDEIRERAAQAALDMIRRALHSQLPVNGS